jgi:RNA-directed DNA polymerase
MHYAFDTWLEREFPAVSFERYADDAVVHCVTERQAREVLAALETRMAGVGLELHPDKTRIVYCKDRNRRQPYDGPCKFTFLGFEFRARAAHARNGTMYASFLPAVSKEALKKMSGQVRRWRIHLRTTSDIGELAEWMNPVIRGWIGYYGRYYPSELDGLLRRINTYLVRWARRKFKRLRAFKKAKRWWNGLLQRQPRLFAHWARMPYF